MKTKFLSIIAVYLMILAIAGCKKEESCPVAFNYTIVDSLTLQPLIGYHNGARYDPELFEFQMNVEAEKNISYEIGGDSGAVFTIWLSNSIKKNILAESYVLYNSEVFDTLVFFSSNPALGLESIYSKFIYNRLHYEVRIFENAGVYLNCWHENSDKINTLIIKN